MMKKFLSKSYLASFAIGLAAGALAVFGPAALQAKPAGQSWATTVTRTSQGAHIIGNPNARRKLIEYASYTCSHCRAFEEEATRPLLTNYIADGSTSIEIRNYVRDPIDMTAALLANCGGTGKFQFNHSAFMRSQPNWMAAAARASDAQRKSWSTGDYTDRMKKIANDLGFYGIMKSRGITQAQANACLANNDVRSQLVATTSEGNNQWHILGTPSFILGGILLTATSDWKTLEPQLRLR